MSLQEEVRHFIVDNYLHGKDAGLSVDSSFLKVGIVDSTDIVQLTAFIEEQYLITIEDAELTPEHLDSIRKVALFIEEKMRPREAGALRSALSS